MREIINYILEANLALLLFLGVYKLLLNKETHFKLMRFFLLGGIMVSLVFPMIQLNTNTETGIPSVGSVLPSNWLPEVVIPADGSPSYSEPRNTATNLWEIAGWVYVCGALLFFTWLIVQLIRLIETMKGITARRLGRFRVIESNEDKPTFSFFNLIYIGRANDLSDQEKEQIIRHEAVHASQLHSLDILMVTLLRAAFWFNPFINTYKKTFIQLHEFEADARAVESTDVNKYCSLLARVTLQSVYFPIASHFNHSLTVKRIEMLRAIKNKIRPWKIVAIAILIPAMFFIISCQDQLNEIAQSTISQTGDYPPEVRTHMDKYLQTHPDAKLTYMEGLGDEVIKFSSAPEVKSRVVYVYHYREDKKGILLTDVVQHAEALQTEDKVFMVVEQQPEFPGGYDAMKEFMLKNIKYPEDARKEGISGTVYVSMVINNDGSVTDVKVLRGVSPSIDTEALRAITAMPTWIPGRQNGKAVKVRFNIPIKFGEPGQPSSQSGKIKFEEIEQVTLKMNVSELSKTAANGQTIIKGRVTGEDGKALPGVNVVLMGTTTGISTDLSGNFSIKVPEKGKLAFSFVGFESKIVDF